VKDAGGRNRWMTVDLNIVTLLHRLNKANQVGYADT
jgi:hypothetical protein